MKNLLIIVVFFFTFELHAEKDKSLESALIAYFQADLPNYDTSYFDFNGDGIKDAFVYLNDLNWCGSGGCTSFVFTGTKNGFDFQSKSMITLKPILVSSNVNNGWHDLIVSTGRFNF